MITTEEVLALAENASIDTNELINYYRLKYTNRNEIMGRVILHIEEELECEFEQTPEELLAYWADQPF